VKRLFYAAAGPGDIIKAHQYWRRNIADPNEVAVTFSSQIAQFCEDRQLATLMISPKGDGRRLHDGLFKLEHWERPARHGMRYHLAHIAYGLKLLKSARRFGADVAIVDIGATYSFVLALFKLCKIDVIVILHNTLWPAGFPPRRRIAKVIQRLDQALFWRNVPRAAIGVSHECIDQVAVLAPRGRYPRLVTLAQFDRAYFDRVNLPPAVTRPFDILFVGRAERIKGLFDLVEIAAQVEKQHAGLMQWTVCGDGPDLAEFRTKVTSNGLDAVFRTIGWTQPEALIGYYSQCHAAIVPTRSDFAEGMAMTAIQSICAGRPLITTSVVPALHHLRAACLEATPDDCESYADHAVRLATDATLYATLRANCTALTPQFYDGKLGLRAVLHKAFDHGTSTVSTATASVSG
jgi:glycogen synthase